MSYNEMSPNQLRVLIDSKQTYDAYRNAGRLLRQYAGGMFWKKVNGREYLVKVTNRYGGNRSLGPRSGETERIIEEYVSAKERAQARESSLAQSVKEFAGMSMGVGISRVPSVVCAILQKLDEFQLLEKNLMVIGTNAMYGYESSAGVMFDSGLMGTSDIDFLWDARTSLKFAMLDSEVAESGVMAILKKIDRSFEPVAKNGFRAVNKTGFYVDLVKQAPTLPWKPNEPERISPEDLTPSWLQNIKWLLSSKKFRSIVIGQNGMPAPMVSPDPRAFSIYKLWLSKQFDREPEKKKRDYLQGKALIDLVRNKFPHMPFDENAVRMFPLDLRYHG